MVLNQKGYIMSKVYKIRNKNTGLFFNKDTHIESSNGSSFKQVTATKTNIIS
jgi:phage antirepressor YoqD-like protein